VIRRLLRLGAACAVAIGALGAVAAAPAGAQPAPYRHWRTLATPHFRVHVERGLEREGRAAAAAAERAYARLSEQLAPPRGTIDLVVSDDADYSNGFALVAPSNRIVVYAAPPIENAGLRLNEDWLALVITHELTHVFHVDRVRGAWRAAQTVFGRAPYLFPNTYGPSWLTEGLAVYEESRLTRGGRLHDAEHRVLARSAALEGKLFRLDELGLGTSRFPQGDAAYAYGSLFVDWLARTHGDSSIRRFVDAQAAQLVPYWLDPAARSAFGTSFGAAYREWSDSVRASVTAPAPPLPGWRELTAHGYFAVSPRWVDDTTLVYTGSDGRETNAAYLVTTSGRRTRLGRRNSRGANVPLVRGGLLYAQLDFTSREEVRSDLYFERDGRTARLTRGARLLEPDVRRDGTIAAVLVGPTRSSLVLLDAVTHAVLPIAAAGRDEVFAEPRWSPDGTKLVVAHRYPGGQYAIEGWDVVRHAHIALARADHLLTSPSWLPDGQRVVYVSERSGVPSLVVQTLPDREGATDVRAVAPSETGLRWPEVSPDGRWIAAVSLRADGYHVGIAPLAALGAPASSVPELDPPIGDVHADTASGAYTEYSPLRTLLPRYWYPIVEDAPTSGTRLGALTSGSDVLGRHAYSAFVAVPTSGWGAVGGLAYRYAGLRAPLLDVVASQNVEDIGDVLLSSGDRLGALLRRTRDGSASATFVRPRVRTSASLSVGLGVEVRDFATDPGLLYPRLDSVYQRGYTFPRLFLGAAWNNLQRPALSISPEDGVAVAVTMRERWRTNDAGGTRSLSTVGTLAAYRSLDLPGFAHHVLALRVAGGLADRRTGTALEVGGTSGSVVDLFGGYTVGEGRRTFGVRGFPGASTWGTRAAAATLEYRAPLVLASRGLGLLPFFLDRTALALFGDWGVATCVDRPLYASSCAPPPVLGRPIASVGGELLLDASILSWDAPQTVRLGLAAPVAGRALTNAKAVSPYVSFGFSF
jgi:hypothetical protein